MIANLKDLAKDILNHGKQEVFDFDSNCKLMKRLGDVLSK